jgi:hypothetical protein
MKKTIRQKCLNKVIDSCLNVIGSDRASEGQRNLAIKLLNRAYAKSGANVHITSIKEISEEN